VIGEYSGVKTGFVADLVFGPRGSDAIFNAPFYRNARGGGTSQLINQMYVYYDFSRRIRVSAGQFNTFLGYEFISPAKNPNYSTSYLFSYGPFNHTGIFMDLKMAKDWSAKVAVMNPTDYTEYNPFGSYTLGVQVSRKYKNGVANLNATYGDPDGPLNMSDSIGTQSAGKVGQLDFTGTVSINARYSIGLSASFKSIGIGYIKTSDTERTSVKSSGYYGAIIYQTLAFSETYSLCLRTELFSEFNGGVGAINNYNSVGDASLWAVTLSGNLKASHLTLIPEIRIDKTSTGSFTYANSANPSHQLVSVNFAVVYTLPTLAHRFHIE
jgi:hypothetical protein